MVLDVRDLAGHPGASRQVRLREPLPGLATSLAEVPAERPLALDLLLESVVEGILASGVVRAPAALRCARCLTEFEAEVSVEVRELFAPDLDAEEADGYPLGDDELDLAPMVRDAVVLSLPFSPLCRPGCAGLCARCGGNRNLEECSCGPDIDPRWAALERLLQIDDGPDGGPATT